MHRKHLFVIACMLVVAAALSPMMVHAQSGTRAAKPKLDTGYITPESVAAVSLYPQSVLTSPEMELVPTEVLSAYGLKEYGIDPMQIEHVLAIVEPPKGPMPEVGVVMHFSSPVAEGKLLGQLWEQTEKADLKGKPYRKAKGPMSPSIFQPDPQTLIVATDALLQKMVANHASPQEGKMTKMLSKVSDAPDILVVLLVEPLRPMIAGALESVQVPAPFANLKEVPNLVNYLAAKVNLTGDMNMALILRANDEEAAKQIENIVDGLFALGKQLILAQVASKEGSSDPVEQAQAKYAKRASDRVLQMMRPVRNGATLSLSGSGRQLTSVGVMMGLLMPVAQRSSISGPPTMQPMSVPARPAKPATEKPFE